VHEAIRRDDPDGHLFAGAIRRTYDMLLDGVNTGRYRWEQLRKTEKTHCGTMVEINLQRAFKFPDGDDQDYKIAGIDVDCKFSQDYGKWMIPPEAIGHVLLVVWANDEKGLFRAGLVHVQQDLVRAGKGNRDGKQTLTAEGLSQVVPLFTDVALPDNVLLRLSAVDESAIFGQKSGQSRINELFLRVQQRLINRVAVGTVAMQADYMKRVRYSGGARSHLAPQGIIILGQYDSHQDIARQLDIAVPGRGDFVSVRVTPARQGRRSAIIGDGEWSVAQAGDPIVMAPQLPRPSRRSASEDDDL
jgi:hypothetical protein